MSPIFAYIADVLMVLASVSAAGYCLVLSRRLSRLTSFDKGIGGAIAVLSAQVDDMKTALADAKAGSDGAGRHLHELVHQARDISSELELMIAACHDFAEEALVVQSEEHIETSPMSKTGAEVAAPEAPTEDIDDTAAIATFGSRRGAPATPVFRHRTEMQA